MKTDGKSTKLAFDVYREKSDATLRMATMAGAGLPAHVRRKEWILLPEGASPLHSDAAKDIAVQGYCFFRLVKG